MHSVTICGVTFVIYEFGYFRFVNKPVAKWQARMPHVGPLKDEEGTKCPFANQQSPTEEKKERG